MSHTPEEATMLALLHRAEAAEGKARAWDDIARRADDAQALAQRVAGRDARTLGRNVWHVALDEAVRLEKECAELASGGGMWAQNAEHFRQRTEAAEARVAALQADRSQAGAWLADISGALLDAGARIGDESTYADAVRALGSRVVVLETALRDILAATDDIAVDHERAPGLPGTRTYARNVLRRPPLTSSTPTPDPLAERMADTEKRS